MSAMNSIQRRVAVLRELDGSGLSVAEFCRRRGLAYSTVMAWRSTQRSERLGGPGPAFIEVETSGLTCTAAPGPALCAELALPGGVVLRVYQTIGTGGAA